MIVVYYNEFPCDHFRKEIANADQDIANHKLGASIERNTGSEHYILRLLQAVRCGILRTDELRLHCCEKVVDVDMRGDLIQPWPDDLFEAAFNLRFHEYRSAKNDEVVTSHR